MPSRRSRLDCFRCRTIFHAIRSTEGAVMRRRDGGIGCGARGRRMNAPSCTRAAPGLRPGSLGTPARSWLTAGRQGLPEARKKRLTRKAPRASSQRQGETERQKARPGAVWTLRWRAERRHVPATARARPTMTRRLARHPLAFCEGRRRDDGVPAPLKNRGDDARPPSRKAPAGSLATDGLPAEAPQERRLAYPAPQRIGAMAPV